MRKTVLAGMLMLFPLFSLSCGTVQHPPSRVDLEIIQFSADNDTLSVEVKNNGTEASPAFNVELALDPIYLENYDTKILTAGSLASGETTILETTNTLSSSDGAGQHYITARADPDSTVAEISEDNNIQSAYYYDGIYTAECEAVSANYSLLVADLKSWLGTWYDFPTTQDFNMHLLDSVKSGSSSVLGLRTTRTIDGTATSVILFNLDSLHDGYSTYKYDGVTYSVSSSEEVIYHEYTHAYHRQYVVDNSSVSHWNDVPDWFREGLALYTSGEGPKQVRYQVYYAKYLREDTLSQTKANLIDGLEGDVRDWVDAAEDYLAIKFILVKSNMTTLRNILRDNARGDNLSSAIVANLSGVVSSWSDFKSQFQTYAEGVIDDTWPHIPSY